MGGRGVRADLGEAEVEEDLKPREEKPDPDRLKEVI